MKNLYKMRVVFDHATAGIDSPSVVQKLFDQLLGAEKVCYLEVEESRLEKLKNELMSLGFHLSVLSVYTHDTIEGGRDILWPETAS